MEATSGKVRNPVVIKMELQDLKDQIYRVKRHRSDISHTSDLKNHLDFPGAKEVFEAHEAGYKFESGDQRRWDTFEAADKLFKPIQKLIKAELTAQINELTAQVTALEEELAIAKVSDNVDIDMTSIDAKIEQFQKARDAWEAVEAPKRDAAIEPIQKRIDAMVEAIKAKWGNLYRFDLKEGMVGYAEYNSEYLEYSKLYDQIRNIESKHYREEKRLFVLAIEKLERTKKSMKNAAKKSKVSATMLAVKSGRKDIIAVQGLIEESIAGLRQRYIDSIEQRIYDVADAFIKANTDDPTLGIPEYTSKLKYNASETYKWLTAVTKDYAPERITGYPSHKSAYGYREDRQEKAIEIATKMADDHIQQYIVKNVIKLTDVIATKEVLLGTVLYAQINGYTIESRINFQFTDKSSFTVQNGLVYVPESYDRAAHVKFPTTFHDVVLPDGSKMKGVSEESMKEVFAKS